MLKFEITRILESDSPEIHRSVAAVGGVTPGGALWLLSQGDAVQGMEQGRWKFFVRGRDGQPIDVTIATAADGTLYLKGEKDATAPATLLLLPRCKLSELKLPGVEKMSALPAQDPHHPAHRASGAEAVLLRGAALPAPNEPLRRAAGA